MDHCRSLKQMARFWFWFLYRILSTFAGLIYQLLLVFLYFPILSLHHNFKKCPEICRFAVCGIVLTAQMVFLTVQPI